jgi:aspartate dehydrogenase
MTLATNTNGSPRKPVSVALAGFGAVGQKIAAALHAGIPGCTLAAVSASNLARAAGRLAELGAMVPAVPIEELENLADLVVECAPARMLADIAAPFLRAGKTVVVLSASSLLPHEELIVLAKTHGGQIVVPTGALIGLDAVTAAAEGTITAVRMTTRKPVKGLLGAPFLVQRNINIESITEPLLLFRGTPREAAGGFPENLNVAVALSLAGIGPDATHLEIWADPTLKRNVHRIEVEADSARFSMSIENVPTENPKTGRITALSVIAYLRKLGAPLRVGT